MAKKKTAKKSAAKKSKETEFQQILAGFEVPASDPLAKQYELLLGLVRGNIAKKPGYVQYRKVTDFKHGDRVSKLTKAHQAKLIEALLRRMVQIDWIVSNYVENADASSAYMYTPQWDEMMAPRSVLVELLGLLLRKKLPLEKVHVKLFADWLEKSWHISTSWQPLSGIIKGIENLHAEQPIEGETRDDVQRVLQILVKHMAGTELRQFSDRLHAVISSMPKVSLKEGEAWSDAVLADLKGVKPKPFDDWAELLSHCRTATGGKPTKKWITTAGPILKRIGAKNFGELIGRWFPLVDKPRNAEIANWPQWAPNPNLLIDEANGDILKGLVWCCSLVDDASLARELTALAISAYKKVPGLGPRAVKVGNACVYSLGAMSGTEAVGQLAVLKVRVKFGTAQKGIEKALVATAEREGIPRDELEEMSVPAYGLTEVGALTEQLGEVTAKLIIEGRKPELQWFKPDGKQQKTVPAFVKTDFAEELKELKQAAKDIEKMLPAQAARIEQTYLNQQEWDLPVWQERYLDHPLVGSLARRLIWRFQRGRNKAAAIWTANGFVDSRGKAVDWPDADTKVRLWHPLDETKTDKVTAWRDWLIENEVRQPFKQAHREIYILTDAERNTRVYSNRYAAHVLKQHQFNALCAARNWKNSLRLMVDDDFPPAHIVLPSWKLRAEFWVEGAGDEYGVDTNETGTFYYLVTDQVRFYSSDAAPNWAHASGGGYGSGGTDREENHPLEMEQIPPLAFSEVMRDVDLFVGVASVGNDPNWADGGPEGRYLDYWQSYSLGELGSTAATRKTVLERLVPRLKIADRCSFSDRFLIVKGDIRTYRIHLGSGNILMESNDQYLCIVPKQAVARGSEQIFLPFEGDKTLSIILSKALLLADDTKIKDSTIVSQIERA